MRVTKVSLINFRNYSSCEVELSEGRNIIIGDNAQGKTNFLESIEYLAHGSSWRAGHDTEMVRLGADHMKVELDCQISGGKENISVAFRNTTDGARGSATYSPPGIAAIAGDELTSPVRSSSMGRKTKTERIFKINGLSQGSLRAVTHRLVTVSFKSHDLNLLRGGPRFRREWIDTILCVLRPQYRVVLANYQKTLAQRNRLLKMLSERGKVSVADNDQLKVWDEQTAKYGAQMIKDRVSLVNRLLPVCEEYQKLLSGDTERLDCQYVFKSGDSQAGAGMSSPDDGEDTESEGEGWAKSETSHEGFSSRTLDEMSTDELCLLLMRKFKSMRFDEIRRRQTLIGPHRDDLRFSLNEHDAVHFASQGQQRSLVLALKLAELKAVSEFLHEAPVLLLDDVLAELDLNRQSLLMSLVGTDMQTIITTTHVTGFRPEWLENATFLQVSAGTIGIHEKTPC
jgi:DNA replication and repair protein RecF